MAMDIAGTADDPDKIAAAMQEVSFVTPWGSDFWLFPHGGEMFVPYAGMSVVEGGEVVSAIRTELTLEDYNSPFPWYDLYKQSGGK